MQSNENFSNLKNKKDSNDPLLASSGEADTPPGKPVVESGMQDTMLASPKTDTGIKLRIIGSGPDDDLSRDKNALSFS